MATELTYEQIVSTALKNLQVIINKYNTNNPQVFIEVHINNEGTGPVIIINFSFSKFNDNPTMVSIELWYHPKIYTQYVLIYSAMDKETEIDHQSHDLEKLADAYQYFEKAILLFDLEENKT